jgi:hypothetical protein
MYIYILVIIHDTEYSSSNENLLPPFPLKSIVFFSMERPATYPDLHPHPACVYFINQQRPAERGPPKTPKGNTTQRDKHASAPSGVCHTIGRSHGAKLGYRLSAVSAQTQKECGGSVRPLREHDLNCGYFHSYPPMTDKPPEAGGQVQEERSRGFRGSGIGRVSRVLIPLL